MRGRSGVDSRPGSKGFFGCEFAGFADEQGPRHIHGDGFGHIDMFACSHRGPGLFRIEIRHILDEHRLDTALDEPLVA